MVTDSTIEPPVIVPMVGIVATSGADVIQVRYPLLPARALFDLATAIRRETSGSGARIIVNDRVDVAIAANADGVHLGRRGLPVEHARRVAGPGMIVGASVHGVEEAHVAAGAGADYLMFGHVFPTPSHPGEPARGIELLQAVVTSVAPLPVIAIGGITTENAPEVVGTGAYGVAVIRAILASPDLATSTSLLAKAIQHDPTETREGEPK